MSQTRLFSETSCVNIFPIPIWAHALKPEIAPRVLEPNEHDSRNATFPVREGALILFPAWMPHSVESHQAEQERISISFSIMFRQFGEEMAQPKRGYEPGSQPSTAS